jgi:RimJ/RimL family protein N-acetyltransferase
MTDSLSGSLRYVPEEKPIAPSRTGRWLCLLPIRDRDYDFLYSLAVTDPICFHWRFPAALPSSEIFRQHLPMGLLAKFIVGKRKGGTPIGMVAAYNQNLGSGTTYIASSFVPEVRGSGILVEAFELFLYHLFHTWNLRKAYFEVPEYAVTERINNPDRTPLTKEGQLRQHVYRDGHWWDQVIFSLYREAFDAYSGSGRRPSGDTGGGQLTPG